MRHGTATVRRPFQEHAVRGPWPACLRPLRIAGSASAGDAALPPIEPGCRSGARFMAASDGVGRAAIHIAQPLVRASPGRAIFRSRRVSCSKDRSRNAAEEAGGATYHRCHVTRNFSAHNARGEVWGQSRERQCLGTSWSPGQTAVDGAVGPSIDCEVALIAAWGEGCLGSGPPGGERGQPMVIWT
jgi:hypothetical protein